MSGLQGLEVVAGHACLLGSKKTPRAFLHGLGMMIPPPARHARSVDVGWFHDSDVG
eukprot:CAMPEP_0202892870 /NCGR_PEP_ID=MMETSP1392-20130828/2554_1 /ASSEMBLY_ACC=CAM_ASM_000868 /TAXON_ID=225041 /ORGANISM="Chlamydomonas chlamydogama, Strain SAG 11-48b" /LENGTH=55 /DNA_ID=CAMNT_0049576987 /DNA_START=99 /DNA_END=265 /DNA_ORIENTATION=+